MSQAHWVPLESNPEVINKYLTKLGVANVQCVDVFGFEPDLLAMIPNKAVAILLLFPASPKFEEAANEEQERLKAANYSTPENVYFIKQNIGNACGTIALIHALSNNEKQVNFGNGCFKKFFEASKAASPEEKAKMLEADEDMRRAHETSAEEGDTAAPPAEARVDFHFVALVNNGGVLYECEHGKTDESTFLADAAKVCKKFMELEPDSVNFTGLALTVQ